MYSDHSSGRKLRHRDTQSVSCRQIQGPHNKLLTQNFIKSRDKSFESFPRRLIAYLREAWTGPTEEGKTNINNLPNYDCNGCTNFTPKFIGIQRYDKTRHSPFHQF